MNQRDLTNYGFLRKLSPLDNRLLLETGEFKVGVDQKNQRLTSITKRDVIEAAELYSFFGLKFQNFPPHSGNFHD